MQEVQDHGDQEGRQRVGDQPGGPEVRPEERAGHANLHGLRHRRWDEMRGRRVQTVLRESLKTSIQFILLFVEQNKQLKSKFEFVCHSNGSRDYHFLSHADSQMTICNLILEYSARDKIITR